MGLEHRSRDLALIVAQRENQVIIAPEIPRRFKDRIVGTINQRPPLRSLFSRIFDGLKALVR